MKTTLFFIFSLIIIPLFSQTEKGVSPVQSGFGSSQSGSTYAVVVGISDHQDEDIPDLRFADKDAQAFAQWLQSPAGGAIPNDHIVVLQNEKATNARIADALIWMLEESKPGDRAIIYFSGHGDVETITRFNRGYLLTYDSPPKIYMAGAFNIRDLQDIISTMSNNGVQVLMISDACRAGKLAGAEVGGTQATAQNLSQQFANEIKIMSCQPNEFSLEGEQWGGGRGAFSYHLLDGLYGLADKNGDASVNLFEIGRYLEDRVPEETDPHSQMPFTVGDRNTHLAAVDAASLAQLQQRKASEQPQLSMIETKGMEEVILAAADTGVQKMYADFTAALTNKQLLEPAGKSAYDLYQLLSQKEEIKDLHNIMRRNLSVALQEDAQQAVNAYLAANPTEVQRRFESETDYGLYPRYLEKACELLGPTHFYYNNLMAKRYYFEGLKMRLDADNNVGDASYQQAIGKQQQALAFQENAPYILNELGVLHTRLKLGEKAVSYYKKAIELAPEWGLPYINLCLEQYYNNDTEKAMETGEKALALMPNYVQLYNLLGWVNADYGGNFTDKRDWERKGVELSEDFMYSFDFFSSLFQVSKKFQRTIDLLEKAVELDSNYAAARYNLGPVYMQVAEYGKAVAHLKKAVLLDPEYDYAHAMLGYAYAMLGHAFAQQAAYIEGETAFNKAIDLAKANAPERVKWWYNRLGTVYYMWGKPDQSLEAYQKAIQLDPEYYPAIANSAITYLYNNKDFKNAERYFMKCREIDPSYPHSYYKSGNLYAITNRFQDAEYMLLKAIAIKPDFTRAIDSLIILYQETGELGKAIVWQKNLMEIAPDNPLSHISAGKLAYLKKEYNWAETHFQKAVNLDTVSWDNLNDIGHFYLCHSEYEKAKHYLLKVHRLKPNEYNKASHFMLRVTPIKPLIYTYTNLAFIEHDQGSKEAGYGWLDTAWAKYQDLLAFYYKMHLLLYEENYDGAFQQLDLLIQHDGKYAALPAVLLALKEGDFARADSLVNAIPDSLNSLDGYFRARVQALLGHFEKAVELLKESKDLFPYGMVVRDTFLSPLHGRQDFEQFLRRRFPEKYDDLDTFQFEEPEPIYYSENCLMLADFYESEGEHERAKFLREKAAELEGKQ